MGMAGLAFGCSASSQGARSADRAEVILAEDALDLLDKFRIGREIFLHDVVNARATDVLRAQGVEPRRAGAHSYVEVPDGDGLRVIWVRGATDPEAVVQVRWLAPRLGHPIAERLDPPERLEGETLARRKARRVAMVEPFPRCETAYNAVVLPASLGGEPGYYVYFLAATTQPAAFVLAGHVLVHVRDPNDAARNEVRPLSKSCMVLPPERGQGAEDPSAIAVSHFLGDRPSEVHVYTSLLYRRPVYVYTVSNDRLWRIDAPKATFDSTQGKAR
jgi:hypothetical protein